METVIVSSDFRIEIPSTIRESLGIRPGQKIEVLVYNDRMRGFLAGIDTTVERENDRI